MKTTILIAARNAEHTIERAVRSAVTQENCKVLLVDDFSSDDTVALARRAGRKRLEVIRPAEHTTLGATRQTALNAVSTPFGVWLDADDEFLPGRVERLVTALECDGADFASDAIDLFDGATSRFLRRLPIPSFIQSHDPVARLFERNYLQGIGYVAFRTEYAQAIGYDPTLHGAEDVDFVLRAIAARARFTFVEEPGYRLYAYPSSMSRRRENQLEMYRRSLLKHDYGDVRSLFRQAAYGDRVCSWALTSMALFRHEYETSLEFLAEAERGIGNGAEVLEPQGPCPMPEAWRAAFFRASALSMLGEWDEARRSLEEAEHIRPTAEGANNLGVALARQGRLCLAQEQFEESLSRCPGYADAKANRDCDTPYRFTVHPLRREPTRRDY